MAGALAAVAWLLSLMAVSPAHAAGDDLAAIKARVDALQSELESLSAETATRRELGLPLHGFANVDYVHTQEPDGRHAGFALGNFDLYMTPALGASVRGLIELNFEYGHDGELLADLERIEMGFVYSDALTLWVGRFHTPYGYWNTAFHHGVQIAISAARPVFLDFEDAGGILPAHSVGLQASGHWRAGDGKVGYDVYLANGDDVVDGVLDVNAVRDRNGKKLVGVNIHYGFGGHLDGLVLGLHGFRDEVGSYVGAQLQDSTRVNMTGAYGVYESGPWQALAEYYHFNNRDVVQGGDYGSSAWYAQLARSFASLTPYLRYEVTSLDDRDHYFHDQVSGHSYKRQVFGIRVDVNQSVAIKLEGYRDAFALSERTNGARAQLAVAF